MRARTTGVATVAAAILIAGWAAAYARNPSLDASSAERIDVAEAAAAEAAEQAAALRERVDELEGEVASLRADASRASALEEDLEKVSGRVWSSLAKLRERLGDVKGTAAGARQTGEQAAASAARALERAEKALRDLGVLQDRYDYHLRRYHGGS